MTSMSDRSQRPRLWDVARAAGVSAKTVSRVLNGEAGVAADTTARVQAAIAELGFERNEAARQLRTGRMARGRSLCLLVPELGDAGRAELAGSLASAVEAHGYRLLMTGSGSAGEREAELVQNLSEAGVAGFFVVSAAADHRYLIPHLRQGLAAAFLLHPAAQMQADSVLVDEVDAARQATQHLLRFSHRRIAFLGPRHDHLAGYQDALSGSGIPLDPDLVRTAVQEAPEAEAAAREWLAAPVPPTAIVVVGALFGCLPLFASLPAQAAGEAGHGPHHDLARGRSAASASATASSLQLQSGGGPVLTSPSVYLSFWGSPNSSARTYLESFFSAVGGSGWQNVATQYCSNAPVGATSCAAGSTFAGNPTAEWKGSWVDTTAVPSSPVDADIDSAAQRAIAHFGYHAGAVYFVTTPSRHSESGSGPSRCAWHASTVSSSSRVPYTYLPYEPDAGSACGVNAVNPTDSFGHGIFDGFSIVGGHEFMEAITDPFPNNSWIDANGNENADKCQWSAGPVANYTFGSTFFAVQPTWSNANASCAMSPGTVTPPPPPPPPPAPPPTTGGPGRGYAILNSAGAIYTFGSARYYGNLLDHGYPGVAVSLAVTPDGAGYNILTTAGAIYSFGDATYFGNLLDHGYPGPAVAIGDTP